MTLLWRVAGVSISTLCSLPFRENENFQRIWTQENVSESGAVSLLWKLTLCRIAERLNNSLFRWDNETVEKREFVRRGLEK